MKNIIYVIGMLSAAFIFQSFHAAQSISSTQDIIDYMEEYNMTSISKQELANLGQSAPPPTGYNEEYCTSCTEITYCGLDSTDLLQYIDNYRDSVWSKTSPYFRNNAYNPKVLFDGEDHEPEFDARFMDMDIEKLENYLCAIKNSTIATEVNTIRFYYIRYNENTAPMPFFEWKHSLAMVPVKVDDNGLTMQEYLKKLKRQDGSYYSLAVDINNFCSNTAIANHNQLCPPFTGCQHKTLLEVADTN